VSALLGVLDTLPAVPAFVVLGVVVVALHRRGLI
jgi:hypothetical protein